MPAFIEFAASNTERTDAVAEIDPDDAHPLDQASLRTLSADLCRGPE
jgi:hypothetical protein